MLVISLLLALLSASLSFQPRRVTSPSGVSIAGTKKVVISSIDRSHLNRVRSMKTLFAGIKKEEEDEEFFESEVGSSIAYGE